ncbi:MAG: hypothetical protein LBB49_05625 [Gracilibacteraceae bacterium]|jgi:hypothetical protein|nr:hypothetical protein [Gracilibacteraceae bacterium]
MGTSVVKGVTQALIVTILALAAVMVVSWLGAGSQYLLLIIDVGLVLGCIIAGYRAAFVANRVLPGIVAVMAYVFLVLILLSFYFQILPFGALKVLTGAVLIAMVSALAGKGRSMYEDDSRSYYGRTPQNMWASMRARRSFPRVFSSGTRSVSSISVDHSDDSVAGWPERPVGRLKETAGQVGDAAERSGESGGRAKMNEKIPPWWERGRRS